MMADRERLTTPGHLIPLAPFSLPGEGGAGARGAGRAQGRLRAAGQAGPDGTCGRTEPRRSSPPATWSIVVSMIRHGTSSVVVRASAGDSTCAGFAAQAGVGPPATSRGHRLRASRLGIAAQPADARLKVSPTATGARLHRGLLLRGATFGPRDRWFHPRQLVGALRLRPGARRAAARARDCRAAHPPAGRAQAPRDPRVVAARTPPLPRGRGGRG